MSRVSVVLMSACVSALRYSDIENREIHRSLQSLKYQTGYKVPAGPPSTVAVRVNLWEDYPLQVKVFAWKQCETVSPIHFVSKQQWDTVHMLT